jgi:hypothetical protein
MQQMQVLSSDRQTDSNLLSIICKTPPPPPPTTTTTAIKTGHTNSKSLVQQTRQPSNNHLSNCQPLNSTTTTTTSTKTSIKAQIRSYLPSSTVINNSKSNKSSNSVNSLENKVMHMDISKANQQVNRKPVTNGGHDDNDSISIDDTSDPIVNSTNVNGNDINKYNGQKEGFHKTSDSNMSITESYNNNNDFKDDNLNSDASSVDSLAPDDGEYTHTLFHKSHIRHYQACCLFSLLT